MNRKWIKIAVGALVVVAVAAAGYYGFKAYNKPVQASAVEYVKVTAKKDKIEVNISASGTIMSALSQDVLTSNSGIIDTLNIKEGDMVKKGDVVAKLKDSGTEQDIQKTQNTLSQQNLNLTKLRKNLDSLTIKAPVTGTVKAVNITVGDDASFVTKTFSQQGFGLVVITGSDGKDYPVSVSSGIVAEVYVQVGKAVNKGDNLYRLNGDDIKNSIDSQVLQIQQTEADLQSKRDLLAKTTLVSPIDGIVAYMSYAAGNSIQSGKVLATIIDISRLQTVVAVDELDIAKVKLGQKAQIAVDAMPDKSFQGEVTKIATLGKTTNGVTTYDITIAINSPEGLKIGMTTNAKIVVDSKEDVVVLPIEAVQGKGNAKYVYIPEGTSSNANKLNKKAAKENNTTGNTAGTEASSGNQAEKKQGQKAKDKASKQNLLDASGTAFSGESSVKQVKTGLASESFIEITNGVSDGEEVLIPIYNNTNSEQRTFNPFNTGSSKSNAAGSTKGGKK